MCPSVCLSGPSGPSGPSVLIEFPRTCITVNPRNCTYEFPRRCISVNPRKCSSSVKSTFTIAFNSTLRLHSIVLFTFFGARGRRLLASKLLGVYGSNKLIIDYQGMGIALQLRWQYK